MVVIEGNPETGNSDTSQHRDDCHYVEIAQFVCYVARNDATRNRSDTDNDQHDDDTNLKVNIG